MAIAEVAVVGGGPAGLIAAEAAVDAGASVDLYDAMPSVGRKFLLAGKGGLNLTHSEPFERFVARYGARRDRIEPLLRRWGANELRAWAAGLGVETFVGSSGRVFPADLKAAPLLRAWLHRLRAKGVRFHMRHRCIGLARGDAAATALRFAAPAGELLVSPRAVVLALGGASWPQLGSDGAWAAWLQMLGVPVAPLQPSNCGFDVPDPGWSEHFQSRFAGHALKNVALAIGGFAQPGEFVVTATGVEGSLVYAASGPIRDTIAAHGQAVVQLDLLPQRDAGFVAAEVTRPRGPRSLATHLKSRLGIDGVKAALLRELLPREASGDAARLAAAIKALPLALARPRPIAEAISTAGGVPFDALDGGLMLQALPGVFCAGEMLDWEAPTGGYLLTACFATGRVAGEAAARHR
jgi:uncharacterized flavoprotein (TIGR03862 family)